MACAFCVRKQPVVDLRQLHIGDHIEFGRKSMIKPFLKKIISETEHIRFGYLYFHHAIVTEINHVGQNIKFVEFGSNGTSLSSFLKSSRMAIIRESQMNFIDIYSDIDIFHVIHKNIGERPPTPHEIVKNARCLLKDAGKQRYNIFLNNCEHLANMCVTQRKVSLQIREVTDELINTIFTDQPTWFKTVCGILWKQLFKLMKFAWNPAFAFMKRYFGKWLGCNFAIAIIFMSLQIFKVYHTLKDQRYAFCSHCFKVWVVNLSLQLLSTLLSSYCFYVMALGFSFSGFLPFESLFRNRAQYSQLQSLKTIKPGDVITFNHYMPFDYSFHDAIVIDWELQWAAGNMKTLSKSFSTMNEDEIFELVVSLIEEFLRNEKNQSIKHLDIHVQNMTEKGGIAAMQSIPYKEMSEFLIASRYHIQKRNGRWNVLSRQDGRRHDGDVPIVYFLADDKHIKMYHDIYGTYRVEIVHYDLENGLRFPDVMFNSARVVKFETMILSIGTKHNVYKKNFVKCEAYRNVPEVIIEKALEKIGERKWEFFGKWSSCLAAECTIVDLDRYYHRGYRFLRLVQSQCFELLYAQISSRCQGYWLERFIFLMNLKENLK